MKTKILYVILLLVLSFGAQAQTDSFAYAVQHPYSTLGQQYMPTEFL